MEKLKNSLSEKSEEFWDVIKTGRTHLQDATPIRLGQEFLGYSGQIDESIKRAKNSLSELSILALGGTAVGTGIGMQKGFSKKVIEKLSKRFEINFTESSNHFHSQSTIDSIVSSSGNLKTIAVSLMKIGNDIRWLGSCLLYTSPSPRD